MDLFALSKLVVFGGEISRRLIGFSKRIEEAPSSIRSIGFEIRSTCDVLNELHGVLRRQQNERMSSISSDALEEMQEAFDKCDEIIYEVAQGVLVAHERLKAAPIIDDMIVVSLQERAQWPLMQTRLYTLIADLSDAKMDIVLHLLVLQVRSERFYGRKMDVALFKSLNRQQREDTIAHLWHNKMQRDPEPIGAGLRSPLEPGHVSPGEGGSPVLQRLAEETSESDSSDIETSSDCSEKRGRGLFGRFVRRFSGSKSNPNSASASQSRSPTLARPTIGSRVQSERSSLARSQSNSSKSTSEHSSNSARSSNYSARTSSSIATTMSISSTTSTPKRPSLLSITNPIMTSNDGTTQRVKTVSWKHGPTMSAKRGIELTWDNLKMQGDWDEGTGSEERRLGHHLLLSQLSSRAAMPRQNTLSTPSIVDMLVMRWTTSPRHRRDSYIGQAQTTAGPSKVTFYSAGGDESGAAQRNPMLRVLTA